MKKSNVNKVESTKVESAKVESAKVESVEISTLQRKFKGIDYNSLSRSEQKKFRENKRRKLFTIIDDYFLIKSGKKSSLTEKDVFESFKSFLVNEYNIPLSEAQNVFKGSGKRLEIWNTFIPEFKAYLTK